MSFTDLKHFAYWLHDTPASVALRESLYVYAWTESLHVIALTLFVGTIWIIDLRLIGLAFRDTPVSRLNSRVLPWTIAGFAIMIVTGALLFYAVPIRTFHSLWFRIKLLLLLAGALNVFCFHARVKRDRALWDSFERPPLRARLSGLASLLIWALVIIAGRMIAYDWFDCDRPQAEWVRWFTQC